MRCVILFNFFLPDLIAQLEEKGKIERTNEQYAKGLLARDLKCHVCGQILRNMPTLKNHISTHFGE